MGNMWKILERLLIPDGKVADGEWMWSVSDAEEMGRLYIKLQELGMIDDESKVAWELVDGVGEIIREKNVAQSLRKIADRRRLVELGQGGILDLKKFSFGVRINMLSDSESIALIGCIGLVELMRFVSQNIGDQQLNQLLIGLSMDLEPSTRVGDAEARRIVDLLVERLRGLDGEGVQAMLVSLYVRFRAHLVKLLGESKAKEVFSGLRERLVRLNWTAQIQNLNFIVDSRASAQDVIGPELGAGMMDWVRVLTKAKVDLESKVEALERANGELEKTKKVVVNLLEDGQALEEKLRMERDRVEAIVSLMGEGLLVVDRDLKVTLINEAAQRLLAVRSVDVVGRQWSEVVNTEVGEGLVPVGQRSLAMALHENRVIYTKREDNHYYRPKNGHRFPVASVTTPLVDAGGTVVGAIKVFRDVTSEKSEWERIEQRVVDRTRELLEKNQALERAQAKISEGWLLLEKEKARLSASINSLSLGFVLVGLDEKIEVVNPALLKMLGLEEKARVIGDIFGRFEKSGEINVKYRRCLAGESSEVVDVLFGARYLHLFLAPIIIKTAREEVIGVVILVEDVTEARVLARSRDEFFTIASHELRTPLTAIRGNASMILEYYRDKIDDPGLREIVGDIHESSLRLIGIVNDFLDVSRLEQGKMSFKLAPLDLGGVLERVVGNLRVEVERKGLSLEIVKGVGLSRVMADEARVEQILVNLIGNALKFTEQGGLRVSLEPNSGGTAESEVGVLVADTGRGIAPEMQGLLFHKFQQAGDSLFTRDTTKGTGLGLYISKLMAEGMGGKVWLKESALGKGSVFVLSLPVIKNDAVTT